MKFLKYLLYAILALIGLTLLIAAFLPKQFKAGSEIIVNKPQQEVFDYIKLVKNQSNYDNWSRQDPHIQKEYMGVDGTPGFTYTWKSKKVGDGKQVITHVEEPKRIDMDLYFNGSEDANKSFMEVISVTPSQSKVIWKIEGSIPYPFNIMTLCYDMSKDFDAGLANLKDILEKP